MIPRHADFVDRRRVEEDANLIHHQDFMSEEQAAMSVSIVVAPTRAAAAI
jgi:hypothetical protein